MKSASSKDILDSMTELPKQYASKLENQCYIPVPEDIDDLDNGTDW